MNICNTLSAPLNASPADIAVAKVHSLEKREAVKLEAHNGIIRIQYKWSKVMRISCGVLLKYVDAASLRRKGLG